jgi:methionyl-tRNA synthetase
MIINNCQGLLPANNNSQMLTSDEVNQLIDQYFLAFDNYQFDRAIEAVILIANLANKNFNDLAPWNLKKLGKIQEMNNCLNDTVQQLKIIAILLLPFIPDSANKILDLINLDLANLPTGAKFWIDNVIDNYMRPCFRWSVLLLGPVLCFCLYALIALHVYAYFGWIV